RRATLALLSAHMIIFWLSQDSNVTPPVCIPAFAAAAIAGAGPMATGMVAWRLAKSLYFVPLMFAYQPFLSTDLLLQLKIAAFAIPGIYALSASFEGHAEARLSLPERAVFGAAGFALIVPFGMAVNWAALAVFGTILSLNLVRARRSRAALA
ncbi:MAG: TRAP transporter permease, partial [Acetobacteraceae bacterium]